MWSFSQALMAEYDLVEPPLLQLRDQIQAVYAWQWHSLLVFWTLYCWFHEHWFIPDPNPFTGLLSPIQQSALQCEASAWCTHAVGKAVRQEWLVCSGTTQFQTPLCLRLRYNISVLGNPWHSGIPLGIYACMPRRTENSCYNRGLCSCQGYFT